MAIAQLSDWPKLVTRATYSLFEVLSVGLRTAHHPRRPVPPHP